MKLDFDRVRNKGGRVISRGMYWDWKTKQKTHLAHLGTESRNSSSSSVSSLLLKGTKSTGAPKFWSHTRTTTTHTYLLWHPWAPLVWLCASLQELSVVTFPSLTDNVLRRFNHRSYEGCLFQAVFQNSIPQWFFISLVQTFALKGEISQQLCCISWWVWQLSLGKREYFDWRCCTENEF